MRKIAYIWIFDFRNSWTWISGDFLMNLKDLHVWPLLGGQILFLLAIYFFSFLRQIIIISFLMLITTIIFDHIQLFLFFINWLWKKVHSKQSQNKDWHSDQRSRNMKENRRLNSCHRNKTKTAYGNCGLRKPLPPRQVVN